MVQINTAEVSKAKAASDGSPQGGSKGTIPLRRDHLTAGDGQSRAHSPKTVFYFEFSAGSRQAQGRPQQSRPPRRGAYKRRISSILRLLSATPIRFLKKPRRSGRRQVYATSSEAGRCARSHNVLGKSSVIVRLIPCKWMRVTSFDTSVPTSPRCIAPSWTPSLRPSADSAFI